MEYLPSNVFARVTAASDLIGADCVMPLSVDSIGMRFNRSAVAVIVEGEQVPVLNCRWNIHDSSLLVEAADWQSHAAFGRVRVLEPGDGRAIHGGGHA